MNGRRAGVLAHPTSLPGPFGIGDLGSGTLRFLDWAAEAGLRLWQILPLGPTGPGHSPYSSLSVFAGEPLLISLRRLVERGWLDEAALADPPGGAVERVEFERVLLWKENVLRASWLHFQRFAPGDDVQALQRFVEAAEQASWLSDWALFAALRRRFAGAAWTEWGAGLRAYDPAELDRAGREEADELEFQRYLQFVFAVQWNAVHRAAAQRGLTILGDLPFYPAHDSADVWAHRRLFRLDDDGRPTHVAGVPPDYFSETGQRWGNPLYRWSRLATHGFSWWVARLRHALRQADLVRLDHFRAFAAYWEIEAGEETAAAGRWVAGPGRAFFEVLREELGGLPLVAEDLGDITDDVHELRDALALPGMRVLQFGLDGAEDNPHHPGAHPRNAVAYTGTHDNDTTRGWFESLEPGERQQVLDELKAKPANVVARMIESAYESKAETAVVPLQDLLNLGSEARMNRPGAITDNWNWRADPDQLTLKRAQELRLLAESTHRAG